MSQSYRIDEFRHARQRRQSRSPEPAGEPFLNGKLLAAEPTNHTIDGDDAAARVRDGFNDCLQRRAAGEAIEDDVLIAAHPELMPELGAELRQLRQIAAARSNSTQPLSIEAETISR